MNIAIAHTVIIAALKAVGYDKSIICELRDLLDVMRTSPSAGIPAEIVLVRNDMAVSMRVYKLNN